MTAQLTPPADYPGARVRRRRSTWPLSANSPCVVEAGAPHPLGATVDSTGVNFSVFSEHADPIELLLFDEHDSIEPFQTIELGRPLHRSFHFWHCYVRDLKAGVHYAYRVSGPWDPSGRGFRFNREQGAGRPVRQGHHHDPLGSRGGLRPGRQPGDSRCAASSST